MKKNTVSRFFVVFPLIFLKGGGGEGGVPIHNTRWKMMWYYYEQYSPPSLHISNRLDQIHRGIFILNCPEYWGRNEPISFTQRRICHMYTVPKLTGISALWTGPVRDEADATGYAWHRNQTNIISSHSSGLCRDFDYFWDSACIAYVHCIVSSDGNGRCDALITWCVVAIEGEIL